MSKKQRSDDEQDWLDNHGDTRGWYAGETEDRMGAYLADTYSAEGDREGALSAEAQHNLTPIILPEELRAHGRGKVGAFADAFNLYCIPMDRTLQAVGRVQDLLSSGAPEVPHDLDRAQRESFHLLEDRGDQAAKEDYKDWRDARKHTATSLHDAMGVRRSLQSAHKLWDKARTVLERRIKERRRDASQAELARLQAVSDLVTGIADLVRDTAATASGVADAKSASAAARQAAGGLPDEFSLNSVLGGIVFRLGDGAAIQSTIDVLNEEIAALGLKAEDLEIDAAAAAVQGIGEQELAAAGALENDQRSMRENAKLFADQAGGGALPLVSLVAEAYQELRLFGDEAHTQAKRLKPYMKAVSKALKENESQIRDDAIHEHDVDAPRVRAAPTELFAAAAAVGRYNILLAEELPDWQHKEALWTGFFEANYGNDKRGRKNALKQT